MSRTRRRRSDPLVRLRGAARQLVALAVLAASLVLAAAFVSVSAPANAVSRDAAALRDEIARLEAGLAAKQEQLAQKQSEAYVVEKAREYGYVREGEAMVNVRGLEAPRDAVPDVQAPGRLARWWAVFFR